MEGDKAQVVRLLDVFVLGPGMAAYAIATRRYVPDWAFWGLFGTGVGTVLYNLHNYKKKKKALEQGGK